MSSDVLSEVAGALLYIGVVSLSWLAFLVFIEVVLSEGRTSPSLPPWDPPRDKMAWRVLAAVRLSPPPTKPCGCRIPWDELRFTHARSADADGVVAGCFSYPGGKEDGVETRVVEATNTRLAIASTRRAVHICDTCGETFPTSELGYTPEGETVPVPRDSGKMRALPDGWTRVDKWSDHSTGEVSGYVHDESWGAFIAVFDATDAGNDRDPSEGKFCAALFAGDPINGLLEREAGYADEVNDAATPLMKAFNTGLEDDGA